MLGLARFQYYEDPFECFLEILTKGEKLWVKARDCGVKARQTYGKRERSNLGGVSSRGSWMMVSIQASVSGSILSILANLCLL